MHDNSIFPENIQVSDINELGNNSMIAYMGIKFVKIEKNFIEAVMPVDHRTVQPYGILHGGASVVLAETLGSIASSLVIDQTKERAVGIEVNANHIKSVSKGEVIGRTSPIHIGKRTHVWNTEIRNESKQLISVSRITIAILQLQKESRP